MTVTVFPISFSNQNGPIMQYFETVTQAVHFTECSGLWSILSNYCDSQNTEFLLLTCPQSKKCAVSLNKTLSRNSGSWSRTAGTSHSTHFSMSAGVSFCLIWILYGYSWRYFKFLWTNPRERSISWKRCRMFFFFFDSLRQNFSLHPHF